MTERPDFDALRAARADSPSHENEVERHADGGCITDPSLQWLFWPAIGFFQGVGLALLFLAWPR